MRPVFGRLSTVSTFCALADVGRFDGDLADGPELAAGTVGLRLLRGENLDNAEAAFPAQSLMYANTIGGEETHAEMQNDCWFCFDDPQTQSVKVINISLPTNDFRWRDSSV